MPTNEGSPREWVEDLADELVDHVLADLPKALPPDALEAIRQLLMDQLTATTAGRALIRSCAIDPTAPLTTEIPTTRRS